MTAETRMTLRQWIAAFNNDEFDSKETSVQCDAGWWDWFCKNESLRNKTYALAPKVKRIAKSAKIDQDKVYVFFKNNCPCDGSLYDDFRICDLETGDVIWTIVPAEGYSKTKGRSAVWGRENGFDGAIVEGTWKDVLAYFEV